MNFVVGVVILLVILAAGAAAMVASRTASAPPPYVPPSVCRTDSDCPHPGVCDVGTGLCSDPYLPGLLLAAQNAAAAFVTAYTAVATVTFTNSAMDRANYLVQQVAGMGLGTLSLTQFMTSYSAGLKNLSKYSTQILAAPGCDPKTSTSCGYYSQIMALTPSSPAATIWSTASGAAAVATELPTALQDFAPLADDLQTLVSNAVSASQSAGSPWNVPTQDAVWDANSSIAALNGAAAALAPLAAAVHMSGAALYGHFITD